MVNLSLDAITKVFITAAYLLRGGNKSHAAISLGISRTTFNKKFYNLDIQAMVEDVAEFHKADGTRIVPSSSLDPKSIALVMYLLESDRNEVITGFSQGDLAHVNNEFLDMIYIAIGGLIRLGMTHDQVSELLDVLRRANVTKANLRNGKLSEKDPKSGIDLRGSFRKTTGFRTVDFDTIVRKMRREPQSE